jgi:hypothetical protein
MIMIFQGWRCQQDFARPKTKRWVGVMGLSELVSSTPGGLQKKINAFMESFP